MKRGTELLVPVAIVVAAVIVVTYDGDNPLGAITYGDKAVLERPVVNIPHKLRQGNWLRRGTRADGSCCHAAFISLLRWQGQYRLADRWRRQHSGGEYTFTMMEELDDADVPYAWCQNGDVGFLEWAIRTRRGACIQYMDDPKRFMSLPKNKRCYHMVNLVDLTPKYACILDNNDPRRFKWMDRDQFLWNWKASEGWAFTPVYSPAAPLPPRYRRDTL